jgi:Na+/H+ antiporter NhaD/arsenite permease-like protein
MLWLAGKYSSVEIISQGFLPCLALAGVSMALLRRRLEDAAPVAVEEEVISLSRGERAVIILSLASFALPLIMNLVGLQPYLGLLLGLGIVWLFIEFAKVRSTRASHLEADIARLLQRVDLASLQFFIGILLAVAALQTLGVLESISTFLFGENQETLRIILGSILLGPLSAIVDNVPLTALAIEMIETPQVELWVLLAITVGTGGSMLIIGSVAGVIAMGMVKELSFGRYLRVATLPAVAGYIAAVAVWFVQRWLTM